MERFIHAGGVRTRIIEDGSGEPILLIHGVGAWAENWLPVLRPLVEAGYRVIACDLPGHGQSARARRVRYLDPEEPYYVRFMLDVLDACDVEQVNLFGHSLGGGIAGVTALAAPDRVRRLVLASSGGLGRDLALTLRVSALPFAHLLARFVSDEGIRAVVRSCFYDTRRIPEWVYADAVRYTRAGAGAEFCRVMNQVATIFGLRASLQRAWLEKLDRLRCPTLVVWGREDAVLPVAHAEAARGLIPNVRVEIIPGAGHLLMVECPGEFLRAVLAFLEST